MKKKEKVESKNSLFIALAITFIVTVILTWIVKNGAFNGAELSTENGYVRLGLHEMFTAPFYSIYYFVIQIISLVGIAGFYGVISKTNGYQTLTNKIGKALSGIPYLFVVLVPLIFGIATSLSTQIIPVLLFAPLFISIASKMKLDKIVSFSSVFGGILLGVLGATYGTETLTLFSYYFNTNITDLMLVKVLIFFIGFLALTAVNIIRLIIVNKKNTSLELVDEFEVTDSKEESYWPIIVAFATLAIVLLLGYVNWEGNFKITIFNKLYDNMTSFKFGKDFYLLQYLLGNFRAFGKFDLESLNVVVLTASVLLSIVYQINPVKYFENLFDGIKKYIKPIALVVFAYSIFILTYWSNIVPTMVNFFMDKDSALSSFLISFCSYIASIFSVDFGYAAYTLSALFSALYPDNVKAVSVILTTSYGLMMFIAPTSIVLVFGLQACNISYKEWFKHIWKFLIAMFIILQLIYFLILKVFA